MNYIKRGLQCIGLLLLASSCSIQTQKLDPAPDIDNTLFDQGEAELAANWWAAFSDEKLNELITLGLKNNQSLVSS